MSNNDPHKKILNLIDHAFIPKGHRPSNSTDIDKMFEAFRGEEIADDKLQRMLRKINGEEATFASDATDKSHTGSNEPTLPLTAEEEQLLALYRAQGEEIPPDIQEKLKNLEERASKESDDDDEDEEEGD